MPLRQRHLALPEAGLFCASHLSPAPTWPLATSLQGMEKMKYIEKPSVAKTSKGSLYWCYKRTASPERVGQVCVHTPPAWGAAGAAWLGQGRAALAQPGPLHWLRCTARCHRQTPTGTAPQGMALLWLPGTHWAGGCRFVLGEGVCCTDQGCPTCWPLLSSRVLSVVWRMLLL